MIYVLAQNPPTEVQVDKPFVGTKSHKVFKRWLDEAGLDESYIVYTNASMQVKKSGTPRKLMKTELYMLGKHLSMANVIITLGNYAAEAVNDVDLHYKAYKLPHPSGLNRKLNDKKEVEHVISILKNIKEIYHRIK